MHAKGQERNGDGALELTVSALVIWIVESTGFGGSFEDWSAPSGTTEL
jgi:hypothetical protein